MTTTTAARRAASAKDSSNAAVPTSTKEKTRKHKYLVIEISVAEERRYPHTLFGCETLEEALKICKQMNTDAGFQKFAVRGNSNGAK
jgi:hypothetical protein